MTVVERILALHAALDAAGVPHAFGGALALAWCTQRARGTVDIDVNVFVSHDAAGEVFDALPEGVAVTAEARRAVAADGQARLWWGRTPVDLFFNTASFHEQAATRVRFESFAGQRVPFLACRDIAVFKVFFDRTQDWADLEQMAAAGTLDIDTVAAVIAAHLGPRDSRIDRLRSLESAGLDRLGESADEAADRRELAAARADDDYVPWDEVKAALGLE